MKKSPLLFFLFLFSFQLFADNGGDEKLRLAIIDIEDKSGKFSEDTISNATEYMRDQFISSNKYTIIPKGRQENAIIKIMKENSYKSCYAENCQIQLGQELSADTILSTAITYFGGVYTLRTAFMNLEKAVIEQGVSSDFVENDEASLRDAIDDIVAQITGGKKQVSRKKPKKKIEESPELCKQTRNNAKEYEWENNYESAISIWQDYLNDYPEGLCYAEAKVKIKSLKDKKADSKLRNSHFFGEYDEINESERTDRWFWPVMFFEWPTLAGGLLIGLCPEDKGCVIPGVIALGLGSSLFVTAITYAVYNNYTKGERAAGFLISFGALAAAGGGTMIGLADGNKSLLGGGIATAVIGAGMLAGGIAIAVLDARARELKGSKPGNYSFFITPDKDGFYAQLGFNF